MSAEGRPPLTRTIPVASPLSAGRFLVLLLAAARVVPYGALESLLWPDGLWGAHFYAFFPRGFLIVAAIASLALVGLAATRGMQGGEPRGAPTMPGARVGLAVIVALASGVLFWLLRERHLFWG